jgi:hypothetical protein
MRTVNIKAVALKDFRNKGRYFGCFLSWHTDLHTKVSKGRIIKNY